jgi:DNA-directed RNA polymerase specialized sigma24 family protein
MSSASDSQETYQRLDLETLWAQLLKGDQAAWEEFHRRYRGWMRRSIRMRLGRSSRRRFDTDDVLQTSFMTAYNASSAFELRDEAGLLAWLRRIITSTYFKMRERESVRSTSKDGSPTESLESSPKVIDERQRCPVRSFRAWKPRAGSWRPWPSSTMRITALSPCATSRV